MTARLAFLLPLALAFASASLAQDAPVARVDGETTFVGYGFFDRAAEDSYRGRSELAFVPRLELRLPGDARVETALQLRGDLVDSSRNRIYLFRGFLDFSRGPLDLRAGRQIIRTGRVDGLRPTDYFRRRNFSDFLAPDEEPIDAARADVYAGDWIFTGIVAPHFQSDVVPLDRRNPWTGPLIPSAPEGSPPIDFVPSSASRPSGLSSGEVGLWVGRRTGGLDWSASYFYGHDRVPSSYGVQPKDAEATEPPSEGTLELLPHYRRLRTVGLDGETTVGSFALRGEASYSRYTGAPEDPAPFEAPFAMFALGADRTFSRLVGTHDLYVNVQYQLDSARPSEDASPAEEYGNRFRHFYRHAVTSLVEYRLDPYRKIATKLFWNAVDHDYVVQSEYVWKPWDGWTWSVGVDVVGGPAGTFFGTYGSNDRARTALTYDGKLWERRPTPPREEAAPRLDLDLQATARLRGEWIALIDGRIVRAGDVVEGAKVVRVDDGVVELSKDGRRFSLSLSK